MDTDWDLQTIVHLKAGPAAWTADAMAENPGRKLDTSKHIRQEKSMPYKVCRPEDLEPLQQEVRNAAQRTIGTLNLRGTDPLHVLHTLRFDRPGYHPVTGSATNLMEQLNQTFTVLATLAAARRLFKCITGLEALCLHLAEEGGRDIHGIPEGVVEAEVYSAVRPKNNYEETLKADLTSLSKSQAAHRYVFFYSPDYVTATARCPELEIDGFGVEVWGLGHSEVMQGSE